MCSTFLDDLAFDFFQDNNQVLYLLILPLFLNLLEIVKNILLLKYFWKEFDTFV